MTEKLYSEADLDKALAEHDAALLMQIAELEQNLSDSRSFRDKLEADNAALREALRWALKRHPQRLSDGSCIDCGFISGHMPECEYNKARALLGEKP